jgi:hypothetical protein
MWNRGSKDRLTVNPPSISIMISLSLQLTLMCGLGWTIAYIEIIRAGLRDRTHAMPAVAMAFNIVWEGIYAIDGFRAVIRTAGQQILPALITMIWFSADVVIVIIFFRYGRTEFSPGITWRIFVTATIVLFLVCFVVEIVFIPEFGNTLAMYYSATLSNVYMSAAFIAMFIARHGTRGQTISIAVSKGIATLMVTIQFWILEREDFVFRMLVLCNVLDLIYAGLIVWAQNGPGVLWNIEYDSLEQHTTLCIERGRSSSLRESRQSNDGE